MLPWPKDRRRLASIALALVVALAVVPTDARASEQGFLGMQVQGISGRIAEALGLEKTFGVLVRDISIDGPASNAGILRGDLIVEMNGAEIDTFERLLRITQGMTAGTEVALTVLRQGERRNLTLVMSEWPDGWQISETAFAAQPELGITLASITPKLRTRLGIRWGTTGVVVTVSNDQFAGLTPLRRGDVVVQVNQQNIWHPKQFLDAYADAKANNKTSMLILVERSDGFKYLLQPIAYNAGAEVPVFKLPGQGG